MRKTKKPAIASEWRENKEAQQRADQKAAREQARAARAEAFARFSGAAGYLMIAGGWVVCIALAVLFGLSLATYSPADPVAVTKKRMLLINILFLFLKNHKSSLCPSLFPVPAFFCASINS